MKYPWETGFRAPKKSRVINESNANWLDMPWEQLYEDCLAAQNDAIALAEETNLDNYKKFIRKKEQEWESYHPEQSCEQNFSEEFPFRTLPAATLATIRREASTSICELFCEKEKLKVFGPQILGQIVKHISTFKLSTEAGNEYDPKLAEVALAEGRTDDLISPARLYRQVFMPDKRMMGVYQLIMQDSKSMYLDKQYQAPAKQYCTLVPLVLMAFKLHHLVPYSHWNPNTLEGIVHRKLVEAMRYEYEFPSRDEILASRDLGLEIKSGSKAGQKRNALHTHKLYGTHALSELPELLQVMLAQIWCAHPTNRTKYMILDPDNWDKMPAPLIETDVVAHQPQDFFRKPETDDVDLPWA